MISTEGSWAQFRPSAAGQTLNCDSRSIVSYQEFETAPHQNWQCTFIFQRLFENNFKFIVLMYIFGHRCRFEAKPVVTPWKYNWKSKAQFQYLQRIKYKKRRGYIFIVLFSDTGEYKIVSFLYFSILNTYWDLLFLLYKQLLATMNFTLNNKNWEHFVPSTVLPCTINW